MKRRTNLINECLMSTKGVYKSILDAKEAVLAAEAI